MRTLLTRFIVRFLWLYLHVVGKTSKFVIHRGRFHDRFVREKQNFIYCFWHNRQGMLLYTHGKYHPAPLISPSKDGEIVAQVAQLFGMRPVRGSSRRGPHAALWRLLRSSKDGVAIGLTPDGPLGPALTVKPGVVFLARWLDIPILPMSVSLTRKVIFKSWDRFLFPLPFGTVHIAYGEPMRVAEFDELEVKALELKAVLDALTLEVDALTGLEIPR